MPPTKQQPSTTAMLFRDQESGNYSHSIHSAVFPRENKHLRDIMRTNGESSNTLCITEVWKASEETRTYSAVEQRVQNSHKTAGS